MRVLEDILDRKIGNDVGMGQCRKCHGNQSKLQQSCREARPHQGLVAAVGPIERHKELVECHAGCEIRKLVGDCIMPRQGIFVRVLNPGEVRSGDPVSRMGEAGG